jgi:hypothetical protein
MSDQKIEPPQDDPTAIAAFLVRENGLVGARQRAMGGTVEANERGDFYGLSIWREVKRILANWQNVPDMRA